MPLTMCQLKRASDSMVSENMEKKSKINADTELDLKAVNTIRLLSVDMVAKVNERFIHFILHGNKRSSLIYLIYFLLPIFRLTLVTQVPLWAVLLWRK